MGRALGFFKFMALGAVCCIFILFSESAKLRSFFLLILFLSALLLAFMLLVPASRD